MTFDITPRLSEETPPEGTPPEPLPAARPENPPWRQAHEAACARGDLLYEDPESGLWVFTRVALEARGTCCQTGCRHCPYSVPGQNPDPR